MLRWIPRESEDVGSVVKNRHEVEAQRSGTPKRSERGRVSRNRRSWAQRQEFSERVSKMH